ncbi:acyl-CoA dehydrogenase [Ekhidna sp.]|uniref:acyl-CoA dehydrogenase family protein n=1 Tax=Ekhidna sp. TaxID=2608089 RepID=UPI0032EE9D3B
MTHSIESPILASNPKLYSFFPLFYMAWADAVLLPSEISAIESYIGKQSWLSKEESDFLRSFLNPKNPPSPQELKSWKRKINETSVEADDKLAAIGEKLSALKGSDLDENLKSSLKEIEAMMGIVSDESAFNLRAKERKTITQQLESKRSFDVQKMTQVLDGDNKAIIDKVKKVLADPQFNYLDTDNLSEYREQVFKWCQLLADQGFGSMAFPKEFGGEGDMKKYFAIMETLSYHDLSTVIKFGVQFGLWGMSVFFLGTEKHHKKYIKDIGSLKLPGCFAMTETGHGSNVKGVETTATYQHSSKSFVIHTPHNRAGKEYIGNAAVHGQMATVFAKLIIDDVDYGVNAFIVPLRNTDGKTEKGVTIEDCGRKMGLNGVDNGKIWFDQVNIPFENMLDRYASVDANGQFQSPITSDNRRFFTMLGTLVGGRIGIPRSGLSATKSGLTIAIRHGDKRKQFGPESGSEVPILNYRTHQRRLMPLLSNAYASHFALQYVTERFLNRKEEEMQEIEAMAAGLKAWSTWNTTHTLQECREACGGKGYLSENRIDRLKNDTDVYTTFEGDNTVLMQLVAKGRLSEFKKEFSDINFFGMMNYVAEKAKIGFTEMNPLIIRNTDEAHLLDAEFHLSAFRYREKDILTSAAKRFKKHLDAGMDSFDAFNQTQYHMVNVGHAYVERLILEQFLEGISKVEDQQCKDALTKLCQLFALSQIEKNKGWYLEHDYMTGSKTKAIRKMVNQLCWEVRQDAVALVDAFNIPDNCLSALIAVTK